MNSVEFNELLNFNPLDPRLQQAAARDSPPGAELEVKRALAFERKLRSALEVEPPAGLADEILAKSAQLASPVRSRRAWMAMAASVSLGALATGWGIRREQASAFAGQSELQLACVDHLTHEPFLLARQTEVPDALVRRAFQERGVVLGDSVGPVHYSYPCPVGPYRALHLVVQAQHGPVTLLYLQNALDYDARGFRERGVQGRLVPLRQGSLVMMAQTDMDFDPIEMRYRKAIDGTV